MTVMPRTAPYGSWKSPIDAAGIATGTLGLDQPLIKGDKLYWIEKRPAEKGRQVIVCKHGNHGAEDALPPPFSARSRVHEYGGGVYCVSRGVIYFVNDQDQGIYRILRGQAPQLIYAVPGLRFADLVPDQSHGQIICICEDHRQQDETANRLVAISIGDKPSLQVLQGGMDFYASPAISADGQRLAWIAWRHPNMPWDGTELWRGDIMPNGCITNTRCIDGGSGESVFQPLWSPDGRLYYVSDKNGWWNIYRHEDDDNTALCEYEAEFGLPQWVFAMSTYGMASAKHIICCYCQQGTWTLARLNTDNGELSRFNIPYSNITGVRVDGDHAVFIGGSPTRAEEIVSLKWTTGEINTIKQSHKMAINAEYLSQAQSLAFPASDRQTSYGFFYRPANKYYSGPDDQSPPLIVMSHGGPTAATSNTLNLKIQYWTSRGFAVLDVNYGGSTGFGRTYRHRLDGQWGVVDVEDCVSGARYLANQGEIDGERIIIRGSSAGGFTTLSALTFTDTFRAGASLYGIGDLESLLHDTHKFESHYLDRLIGPYPEAKELYRARSPLYHTDKLSCPIIFFQGLKDKVVPPKQAQDMVRALKIKGLPVALMTFENEQHGFRQAKNIQQALEGELYFYLRILKINTECTSKPVKIENLDD